jgi:hypothetical protein
MPTTWLIVVTPCGPCTPTRGSGDVRPDGDVRDAGITVGGSAGLVVDMDVEREGAADGSLPTPLRRPIVTCT